LSSKLDPIFSPRSVAVVGASRNPTSMSGRLYRNLRDSFRGPVYAINPHAGTIDAARALPSVLDVPEPVDLAFIAVPAAQVFEVVRECVQKGARGLVVISAGYCEAGLAGRDRQRELLELVRRSRIPMVGPNCFGVINTDPAVGLRGVFSPIEVHRGNVAFGSQSGALGVVIPDLIGRWQLGLSSFVSIGNKADVGENDLLLHWECDPATRVIALYLESFQDPRRFLEHARRISHAKPIVVLKAGRTEAGRRAASSHTAALASQDAAADALFRQAGVIRADTLEELFDIAALLSSQPVPTGRRVAIIGNAGGPAVLCADVLDSAGLTVPTFSQALQETLRASLPPGASIHNPIDLVGTIDTELYRACLGPLLRSDEVDAVITIYVPRESDTMGGVVKTVRECVGAAAPLKPLLGVFMQTVPVPEAVAALGVPVPSYLFPEAAAGALVRAAWYGRWLRTAPGKLPNFLDTDPTTARQLVAADLPRAMSQGGWLGPDTIQRLLVAFGVPIPRWAVVHSPDDAVSVAAGWGSPVVVKVIAPSALHKTEVGAVVVNLRDASQVREGYQRVIEAVGDATGVLIQEYVGGGHEVFIGVNRDPAFGPLIGCGLGGILVELANNVAFRLHPLTDTDAFELVDSGRLGRVLRGYRGRPQADLAALVDVLLRISCLVEAIPELVEMDLNPVLVLPDARGAKVVDVRVRVAPAGEAPPPAGFVEKPCSRT